MFSGYKDAQPFYNNQPLFENRSQASFLPGDASKQTSAPPWDYTQQPFSTVPCYTGDQNLNNRHPGPIHNQVVSQFDNSNVLTHYKNIGTGNNNHQSVVRPRAVINCQSNCNACYNHSVGRIPSHWNSTDNVHYVHGNSAGPLATEDVSRYAPNLSNFSQHEDSSSHFQTGFSTPLNKLSRFSKDSTTSASKTDVLSSTEDCNVLRNPPSDSANVKKDVSATCHGVCNRGKCKFYQQQTIKFPSLEPIPIQQYGVPRENVVRYTGHNSGNSSCNQWPSHQPPGFWIQNGRPPDFWIPPTDNARNIGNSGMTNFWGDNGCEMPNQQLAAPAPSYQDITTNKGLVPIRSQPVKDVLEENKIHHQYQESPPRYTDVMQRKYSEEVQCRPHDALADCGIIQEPQYKPHSKDISRPINNPSMESRSHNNLNGVDVLTNFPTSRSFSSYHKTKVPSTSSNFSTVLGIAQPPSRFSSDPTYTQSKISRSNNYTRFFSENNLDDTYSNSNDIVGNSFTNKITGQHMPIHGVVPGKDVQNHSMKFLSSRNSESIIRYGGEISSNQLQSCGQMSDNGAQYHGMNTMQVIENNPSCSMSGTTLSPPNRRELGYHSGMPSRNEIFYGRQSLETAPFDNEDYSNVQAKVGVISRSAKEACDLNLPPMYVPNEKPQLVPLLEDPSINRPIKKRRPRSKHERWSHEPDQHMSAPVLDVRQYLASWVEEADDLSPGGQKLPDVVLSNSSVDNPLLVLDCRTLNTNGVATLSTVDRSTISEGNGSENVISMYHQQISPSASNIVNDSCPENSKTDSETPNESLKDCPSLIPIESKTNSCIKELPTGKIIQKCDDLPDDKNSQRECNDVLVESDRGSSQPVYSPSIKLISNISENSGHTVLQSRRSSCENNINKSDIAALQHSLQAETNLNVAREFNSKTCDNNDVGLPSLIDSNVGLPSLIDSNVITLPTLKTLCTAILKQNSYKVTPNNIENLHGTLSDKTIEQTDEKEICIENVSNAKSNSDSSIIVSCSLSLSEDNETVPLPLDTLSVNKIEEECKQKGKISPTYKKSRSSSNAEENSEIIEKLIPADTDNSVTLSEKCDIKDSVQKLMDDIDEISENTPEEIIDNNQSSKSSNKDAILSTSNCHSINTNKMNSDEHIPICLNDIAEDLDMSVTSSIPSSTCSIEEEDDDDEMLNMKLQISDSDDERIDSSVTPKPDRPDCKQYPMSPIAIMLKESTEIPDSLAKDVTEDPDKSIDSTDIFANLEVANDDYNRTTGESLSSAKSTRDDCSQDKLHMKATINSLNAIEGCELFLSNDKLNISTIKYVEKDSQISDKVNKIVESVTSTNSNAKEILSHKESEGFNCKDSSSVTESSSKSIQSTVFVKLSSKDSEDNRAISGSLTNKENMYNPEPVSFECQADRKCDESFHISHIEKKSVNVTCDQPSDDCKIMEENNIKGITKPEYQKMSLETTEDKESSLPGLKSIEAESEDLLFVNAKKTLNFNCILQKNKFSKEGSKEVEDVICSANKSKETEECETVFPECERSSVEINGNEKKNPLAESLLSDHKVPGECKKVNSFTMLVDSEKTLVQIPTKHADISLSEAGSVDQKKMISSDTENGVSASDIPENICDSVLKCPVMNIDLEAKDLDVQKIQEKSKMCLTKINNSKDIAVDVKEINNDISNEVTKNVDGDIDITRINVKENCESLGNEKNLTNKFTTECFPGNGDETPKKTLEISKTSSAESTRSIEKIPNMHTERDLSVKSVSQNNKLIKRDETEVQNSLESENDCMSDPKFVTVASIFGCAASQNEISGSKLEENDHQNQSLNPQTILSDLIVDTPIENCHQNVKSRYFREENDTVQPYSSITPTKLYECEPHHSSKNGSPVPDYSNVDDNLDKNNSETVEVEGNELSNVHVSVSKEILSDEEGDSQITDSSLHENAKHPSTQEWPIPYNSKLEDVFKDTKTLETVEMEKCELSVSHMSDPKEKHIEEEGKNQENEIIKKNLEKNKLNQHSPPYEDLVIVHDNNKDDKHGKVLNNPKTLSSTCQLNTVDQLKISTKEVECEGSQFTAESVLNKTELHKEDLDSALEDTKNGLEVKENILNRNLDKTVLCISSSNSEQLSQNTSSEIVNEEVQGGIVGSKGGGTLLSISQKVPSEVSKTKDVENFKIDSVEVANKTSLEMSDLERGSEGERLNLVLTKCKEVLMTKENEQTLCVSTKGNRDKISQKIYNKLQFEDVLAHENGKKSEDISDHVPEANEIHPRICEGQERKQEVLHSVSQKSLSEIFIMEEHDKKENNEENDSLRPNISDRISDKTEFLLDDENNSVSGSDSLFNEGVSGQKEDKLHYSFPIKKFHIPSEAELCESPKNADSMSFSMEVDIEKENEPLLSSSKKGGEEEYICSDKNELCESTGNNFQVSETASSDICLMEEDDIVPHRTQLSKLSENIAKICEKTSEISQIEDGGKNKRVYDTVSSISDNFSIDKSSEKMVNVSKDSKSKIEGCKDGTEIKPHNEIVVTPLDETAVNKSPILTSEVLMNEEFDEEKHKVHIEECKEIDGKVNVKEVGQNVELVSGTINNETDDTEICKTMLNELLEKVINSENCCTEIAEDQKTKAINHPTYFNSSKTVSGKSALLESPENHLISMKTPEETEVDCYSKNAQLSESQCTSSKLHLGFVNDSVSHELKKSSNLSENGNDIQLHLQCDDFSVSGTSTHESTEICQGHSESSEFKIQKSHVSPNRIRKLPELLQNDNIQNLEPDEVEKKNKNESIINNICKTASAVPEVDSDLKSGKESPQYQNLQDNETSMQESEEVTFTKKCLEEKQIALISDAVHSPGSISIEDEDTLEFPGKNMPVEKLNHFERPFESIENTDMNYNLLSPEELCQEREFNKIDRITVNKTRGSDKSKRVRSHNKRKPLKDNDCNNLQNLSLDSSNCKTYKKTNPSNVTITNETCSPLKLQFTKCGIDNASNGGICTTIGCNVPNGTSEFGSDVVQPCVQKNSFSKSNSIKPATAEFEEEIHPLDSTQLLKNNRTYPKEPLSVDTDMPQLEVISTEISPNDSDSLEMPYLECIKHSESSISVLETTRSQDESKNKDETLERHALSEEELNRKTFVSKSSAIVVDDPYPVQLKIVDKNKFVKDNESNVKVSVSLQENASNGKSEGSGNLQEPFALSSIKTKINDNKLSAHEDLEEGISLLSATIETAGSKTKEDCKGNLNDEENSLSLVAIERTEVGTKGSQSENENKDIQEDLSLPVTSVSTEAKIHSHVVKGNSLQPLADTDRSFASTTITGQNVRDRTEVFNEDNEEHKNANEDMNSSLLVNTEEKKYEENEAELPVSPNTLQVIKSYLGNESTTVQVMEVNAEDLPENWESLQIITSDMEYGSEACEKELEKSTENVPQTNTVDHEEGSVHLPQSETVDYNKVEKSIENVPQTITVDHEEGSVHIPQSETVDCNKVSKLSPSPDKSSGTLYMGIDTGSEVLPADSVSNWPYLEEEVFSDLPTANSDNVDVPCSSFTTNSHESSSPSINSDNSIISSDAGMAVKELKCRLSWKKIFALTKGNHTNKETEKSHMQASDIVSDKLDSPNSNGNKLNKFNELNKNKCRKKEIELGPAKIELRLTPTPPPKGVGLPKKWEVVDVPKLDRSSKMSSDNSSTNGGNTSDVHNPVPVVLVKRLILKRRSSDESEAELTAKRQRQIVTSPDNSNNSVSSQNIGENSDMDGDVSNSATQECSDRSSDLSDSEDDNSSVTSTASSSFSEDRNSNCSCSTVTKGRSDPDSKKTSLDSLSPDLNPDVLNSNSKLSAECNNTVDEMSSSSEDRLLPRVIIKRTTGMGSNNYQSFLRSVSSSNECNNHWQPIVRLERSTSLDELAKRITNVNGTNKDGVQHRLKIILKSPQTQPQVHLVPLSLQNSRRHSEPEANQDRRSKTYFSRLKARHTLTGSWRKRRRYNRKSQFSKSVSLSSEPNSDSSPIRKFTVFKNFTKVQNAKTGIKDGPFSVIDGKEDIANADALKQPNDEYRVVENKNYTKENVTKITFQRHKKRDSNDHKIIHIKFKNCDQDLLLTGQKDQDNKESSSHNNENNERCSPNTDTRESKSNERYSPSGQLKHNTSTKVSHISDHFEEAEEQQQHTKKMSITDENESVKSPQPSAEEKNTLADLSASVHNFKDCIQNEEAMSVNDQSSHNLEIKKKRNSVTARLDSDLPFFQSDRILSISSVKRRRSNTSKLSPQPESSASEERCEKNFSVYQKPVCDSAAHDDDNQPADPVLSESPDDVTCQACGHVYADGQERAVHIRRHPYHCQRCHLAFKSETEFVGHLSEQHPRTRERHHCLLCERSFPTADRHKLHLTGRTHRHLELTQRRTIHTLFTIFTGRNCPVLTPLSDSELARLNWFPVEPGTIHFYHQATPLQRAVQFISPNSSEHPCNSSTVTDADQVVIHHFEDIAIMKEGVASADLVTRKRGDCESSSPIPSRSFTSAEDNLSSPSTPSSSSSSSSSS